MELLIEIIQVILEFSDFLSQIRLTQLDTYLHNNLAIYDFCIIDQKFLKLLSDDILKNYKHIKKLNASHNHNITDSGISHMKLHILSARGHKCGITNDGIKHMNLHQC